MSQIAPQELIFELEGRRAQIRHPSAVLMFILLFHISHFSSFFQQLKDRVPKANATDTQYNN